MLVSVAYRAWAVAVTYDNKSSWAIDRGGLRQALGHLHLRADREVFGVALIWDRQPAKGGRDGEGIGTEHGLSLRRLRWLSPSQDQENYQ